VATTLFAVPADTTCNQTEDEETALKARIREAFALFDREGRNAVDVREVRGSMYGAAAGRDELKLFGIASRWARSSDHSTYFRLKNSCSCGSFKSRRRNRQVL